MSATPSLDQVRRVLRDTATPSGPPPTAELSAAVAAVLRDRGGALELLFIRRAEHPRDPWSGHMAWPGGRVDAGDSGPLAAAVRETREELQLDLERDAELLGALPVARTHLRRGSGPRRVAPFVFALHGEPELVPNHEVQEAIWVPCDFLRERRNRRSFVWLGRGVPLVLPCYRWEGKVIWGLTLGMLDDLLRSFAGDGRNPASG